ncbi:MAG: non-heme iron oxygenase ferredoxin subunit [Rubrivivax sp.]|jgi:naphthalene 1,2-dioxygenase system ferredoxin subunit|nr:non-heme iron oxygenase ferredoxin subunit [Rubrivivax sp.]
MSTQPPSDTPWTAALAVDALPTDDVIGVTVAGRDVALYTAEGAVYATDNLCTHGNARLCDGFLEGHEIECPLHQGRFDVRDGQPLCEPVTAPLRSYPVKVEGGRVWLQIG